MNSENNRIIQSYIDDGDKKKEAEAWGDAKISYLKGLEEYESIKDLDPDAPFEDEEELVKLINSRLREVDKHLAVYHFELGSNAFDSKNYKIAIDELEEATRLADEDDVKFLEEIKVILDKARNKAIEHELFAKVTPFVERGDDFRKSGNFGEAILEYQAALKDLNGLRANHRFIRYIKFSMTDCKRNLIRPYLAKAYRACFAGKYKDASLLIKRSLLLLDNEDKIYTAFVEQIKNQIDQHLGNNEIAESEEIENPELWEAAVKDYEEALDLYSSYTVVDPLSPAYTGANVFEDRFVVSRRNLGRLYKVRADKLRDKAKIEKAIKNYKEALKLLPRSDKLFHDAFSEIKKLRGQIAATVE